MHVDIEYARTKTRPSVLIVGMHTSLALTLVGAGRRSNSSRPLAGIDIVAAEKLEVALSNENRWFRSLRISWMVDIIRRWQAMLAEIRRRDIIQLDFDIERSSILSALLILGISGYWGKRSVMALSSVRKDSLRGYRGLLLYRLIKIADTVVAASEDAATWARPINPNVKVIRRTVPSQRQTALRSERIQPRVALASPLDTRLLGSIVRGINLLKQKYPRAELVVIADRRQAAEVRTLLSASSRNGVELTVCDDDFQVAQLLGTCDVYVETSLTIEPSLVQIEALKQRMPFMVTDSSGTSGSFEHGVNGLVIPAGDQVALANRLCELVESPTLASVLSGGAGALAELHDNAVILAEWHKLYSLLHRIGPIPAKRATRLQPQYQPSVKS